jgi:thiol-disulfide isomerase/thioredoxin
MKRTQILLIILFVVAAFALVLTSLRRPLVADASGGGMIAAAQAKMAPDFTLQNFNLRTESAKQPIVMDFWATWCGPCREELPHLVTLSKKYAGHVAFYGINSSDTPADIAAFSRQEGIVFPTLSDAGHKVAAQYGVEAIPLLIVIDTHGKVRAVTEGYDEQIEQNLPKVLDGLLKEK